MTQRSEGEGSTWDRGFRRWWDRRTSDYLKTHASVKAAYRGATGPMAKATAEVLGDGKVVALGTVVDATGYIVTKASLLQGKISCRLHDDGKEMEATLKGVSDDYDLALLKVEATDLTVAAWRTEPVTPGTLVAAVAPDGDAIGIGVIGAEPRAVRGSRRSTVPRGWLGISLGDGDAGVGVADVTEGSAAAKAGLQPGDQVQSIDGQPMRSMEQVVDIVGGHSPGDTLSIQVLRGGQQVTLSAKLQKPPRTAAPEDQWGGGPFSDRPRFSAGAAARHGGSSQPMRRSAGRHGRQSGGSQHRAGPPRDDLCDSGRQGAAAGGSAEIIEAGRFPPASSRPRTPRTRRWSMV